MQESSKLVTLGILNELKPQTILDAPCGGGWLKARLNYDVDIDGIDLFDSSSHGYRDVLVHDLDYGLPHSLPEYDAVVSCEGLEHIGNPDLFLKTAKERLKPGGLLVITTPNVWYPAARLQYLLRGFFPGFPCLTGRIERGTHMHIMPWSFPHLYLYLKLNQYSDITLHSEPLSKPKHLLERLLAFPQKLYCRNKLKKTTGETRDFWQIAMSDPSLYGRHLIVTARAR